MKQTGIIMSGSHPKDILEGRKIQTRRTRGLKKFNESPNDWVVHHIAGAEWEFKNTRTLADYHILCPYGLVGCGLWVRETWAAGYEYDALSPSGLLNHPQIYYREDILEATAPIGKLRPSIFMPRWASRIEGIIKLLRAERLRDISEADAKAEGGYSVEEFIEMSLRLNHLPEDANPWNWVIGW